MTDDRNRESYIRWQETRITQMGYAINLVLGLAVAALGFLVSLLMDDGFTPVPGQGILYGAALVMLAMSVVLGIGCVVNRLLDFRLTAKIARGRWKNAAQEELAPLRTSSKKLGRWTWGLFWWQIGTFGGGVLLVVVGVGLSLCGNR